MTIPFTQYVLPHGRQKEITIDRSAEIEAVAMQFLYSGGKFEAEVLLSGEISLTACKDGEDIDIEICPNGPGVGEAVDRLIRRLPASHASAESTHSTDRG